MGTAASKVPTAAIPRVADNDLLVRSIADLKTSNDLIDGRFVA
jgi:hypothetical protein